MGHLPIRYLGIPLMSRRLKLSDYDPLIDKIIAKFRSWSVNSLSSAGRALLISTVITGLVGFWMSIFILPKGCIRRINSLCSRFLWSGSSEVRRCSKVAWREVCSPKSEGGLGLRSFEEINKVYGLKLIWYLFSKKSSLWVNWQIEFTLKGKSFWELKCSGSFSWYWKSLLSLRHLAVNLIGCILGNGRKTLFWFDNWTSFGPLIRFVGDHGPSEMRIPLQAVVADACSLTGWKMAHPRSNVAVNLHAYLSTIALPSLSHEDDYYTWNAGGLPAVCFSSAKTLEEIRVKRAEKVWAKVIWFKGSIPNHALTMWLANLDRLPSGQRMASWGFTEKLNCVFCANNLESRDHLFISCSFASALWRLTLLRLNPSRHVFLSWAELLSWMRHSSRGAPCLLRRVAAHTLVYHVWRERNNIRHNGSQVSPQHIFRNIDRDIRNIISGRRSRRSWSNLMLRWIG